MKSRFGGIHSDFGCDAKSDFIQYQLETHYGYHLIVDTKGTKATIRLEAKNGTSLGEGVINCGGSGSGSSLVSVVLINDTLKFTMDDESIITCSLSNIFNRINEKYTKPVSGIPATDLADGVIPEFELDPDDNVFKINDKYIAAEFDGNLNKIATTYATKEEVSEKQDTLISGSNIKTIGRQSILGSGDLSVGSIDDVRINHNSIVSDKIANIIYETSLGVDSNNTATVTAIRAYVNSSIEAVAAYYITAGIDGNAFATKAALNAGPWYYAGQLRTPTRNDYAIVIADESHAGQTARYTYVKNDGESSGYWNFQYTFNMTFTQAQIDALNSGINQTKVAAYDSHLSDTTNPHNVTKEQIGLGDVGNFKAVSTVASQGLSSSEKENARANINAYSKPEGGIPKTDIADGVIPEFEDFTLEEIQEIWDAN